MTSFPFYSIKSTFSGKSVRGEFFRFLSVDQYLIVFCVYPLRLSRNDSSLNITMSTIVEVLLSQCVSAFLLLKTSWLF